MVKKPTRTANDDELDALARELLETMTSTGVAERRRHTRFRFGPRVRVHAVDDSGAPGKPLLWKVSLPVYVIDVSPPSINTRSPGPSRVQSIASSPVHALFHERPSLPSPWGET